jgi:hypothetical protein
MEVKPLKWNLGKNLKLKLGRGIGFEIASEAIARGAFQVAKVKSKNHPGQMCFLIRAQRKLWVVPFKENKDFHILIHHIRDEII